MKYERSNLYTYASAVNLIVSYGGLITLEPFGGLCFRHVLRKVFQYTIDEKVAHKLFYTSIKTTQANI